MGEKLIIEELTIFETLLSFDETKAIWKRAEGGVEYCEVLAYVPKQAIATESTYSPKNKQENFHYEIWEHHCFAIWLYHRCDWNEACRLLEEHRDSNTPVGMKFYRNFVQPLSATQVVEYLS